MKTLQLLLLISCLGLNVQSIAQGDLLITPRRVLFEGTKQKEELNLVNVGKDTATFSISFLQYNMNEDGSFTTIEKADSGQMFADPYLRIFPRIVTLAPGEPQVIMLQYRRKAEMPTGEYRSHLYFRSEKNYKPLGMDNKPKDTTSLSMQLIPIYGMSIPVIIRVGETNVNASLSDIKLISNTDAKQNLSCSIHRKGNISAYGNILVDYYPVEGKHVQLGLVKGIGVYTNITKRNISVLLNLEPGQSLKPGKITVRYTSPDDTKFMVYAEGELEIK